MIDIKSLTKAELEDEFALKDLKKFRAVQVYDWMHVKLARSFDEMTNLSKDLRARLNEEYDYTSLKIERVKESAIDGTAKFLFELSDGNFVESVFMRYKHGNSVCISSQVGCRMGCRFCASTLDGLVRSLKPSEMLDQIYAISHHMGERIANIVVMGMGEPLDNFDNLLKFIELITNRDGLNISARNITVSTCGLVEKIRELADKKLAITLALSLHAASDEQRRKLMPVANRYSIEELMQACSYYFETTGRRISFEYSLVSGVNDTIEDAVRLSVLAKRVYAHINLIPVNPIKERDYRRGSRDEILAFKNKHEKNGINVTIRREMGQDIDGACGQLRRRKLTEE